MKWFFSVVGCLGLAFLGACSDSDGGSGGPLTSGGNGGNGNAGSGAMGGSGASGGSGGSGASGGSGGTAASGGSGAAGGSGGSAGTAATGGTGNAGAGGSGAGGAGGSGAAACDALAEASPGNEVCFGCIQTNCCAELSACFGTQTTGNQPCGELNDCLGTSMCFEGAMSYDDVRACGETNCASTIAHFDTWLATQTCAGSLCMTECQ